MANIASDGQKLWQSSVTGKTVTITGPRTLKTPEHSLLLMPDPYSEDCLAVGGGKVAVVAKTAEDKAYGWVEGQTQWTYLGPAYGSQSQKVAWVNSNFRFARIDKGGAALVEQAADGTELRRRPVATSQGILQFDEVANDWVLTDSRLRVPVGDLVLIKAVRRLRGNEIWWAGQVTGPDRLVVTNGLTPLRAGPQPQTPQFLVIGQDFYVNKGAKSPFPPDSVPPEPNPPEPPVAIPNHKDVVERARAKYASYSGPQRAYLICNQVAWDLRGEGAGHLFKDSGSEYNDRSLDIIIYKPNGETFDILGDAEGQARPQWSRTQPTGFGNPIDWRAAVDPASIVQPGPGPGPEPEPPPTGVCKFQSEPCKFTPDVVLAQRLEEVLQRLERIEELVRQERTINGFRWVGQGRIEKL